MKFKQREDGYFISEDGRRTIPNVPGNRDFDRIQAYMDAGNQITKAGYLTIPDDWQKPEPVQEVEQTEEVLEEQSETNAAELD